MTKDPTPSTASPQGTGDHEANAQFAVSWTHRLRFTRSALDPANPVLEEAIRGGEAEVQAGERGMIAVFDDGVCRTHPGITESLHAYVEKRTEIPQLRDVLEVEGGERCKNSSAVLETVLRSIDRNHICRKSTILIVGGGAVLDAAGYAAATAHRGVRLVRMPSTVLSQCDSGVGVKNGINQFGKKNFTGTFAPPWAVVCDTDLLRTLPDPEWRCGFSEIVKIGLLRDEELLDTVESGADRILAREDEPATSVIARSAQLHLAHITDGGDPFELNEARPLDFGHWSAHKLEQMTNFKLRHGEAVSIGLALDLVYSELAGIAEAGLADRVLRILDSLGLPCSDPVLENPDELLEGLQEFREHLGGTLTITLVPSAGRQVDVHEIDRSLVRKAISHLLDRTAR